MLAGLATRKQLASRRVDTETWDSVSRLFAAAIFINGLFHDVGIIIMVNHALMLTAGITVGMSKAHACKTQTKQLPETASRR